jgi:hypothetical protein
LSRAARRGAHITAAALHEGYWVDIGAVRVEEAQWDELRRDFSGPEASKRVAEVLADRGFPVSVDDSSSARRERLRTGALLREGHRVRLAVMRDRGSAGRLGTIELDELLQVTATHEEGHLCDRTRFLPLSKNLLAVLGFLVDCGFSPASVSEALEYRAQLVALCDSPDPRVPLAQVLDSVEDGPSGVTSHASGYASLLEDLLGVLDHRVRTDPQAAAIVDPGYTLAHQLHHVPAELLRSLALELASKKRIVR